MTDAGERSDDRRMRLRYAGRCRLCGTSLAAGADAVYERSRRTVRCVECAPGLRLSATPTAAEELATTPSTEVPGEPGSSSPAAPPAPTRPERDRAGLNRSGPAPMSSASPAPSAPADAAPRDWLRLRAPASAVIAETLRIQAQHPPRSRTARLFGRDPLSPDAEPWYRGALGELEVARVLGRLGEEWQTFHAIPIGTHGSDIDHLVIGPAGVFTINTKRHPGKVWVANRMLMVNGQRTHHLRNAEHEGKRAARILSVPVTPLIVVVGARTFTVRDRPEKVVVLRSGDLVRWLTRSAPVLTPPEVQELASRAADPATWGASEPAEPDLAAFGELRASRASADRRRRAWGLGVVIAVVASALVALQNLASIGAFISRALLADLP